MTVLAAFFFGSCEKMETDEDRGQNNTVKKNVVIRVGSIDSGWEGTSTRGLVDISEVCSKLCFAIYQNGTRVKYKNQNTGDDDFGTLAIDLDAGNYQLMVLGHSGMKNPTTTNPAEIEFTNPGTSNGTGFTDTFYYYGNMTVSSDGAEVNLNMKRATSMFRLLTTDKKPTNVKKFQFYYTGGSGALNTVTGYGYKSSKQSVFVETGDELTNQTLTFEMYTFLHEESGYVNFLVKAFDANEDIVYSKEFKNVPMQRNCITQYSGIFFTNGDDAKPDDPVTPQPTVSPSVVVKVDPEWGQIFTHTY